MKTKIQELNGLISSLKLQKSFAVKCLGASPEDVVHFDDEIAAIREEKELYRDEAPKRVQLNKGDSTMLDQLKLEKKITLQRLAEAKKNPDVSPQTLQDFREILDEIDCDRGDVYREAKERSRRNEHRH